MNESFIVPRQWQRAKIARNLEICRLYASGRYMTEQIAKRFDMKPRNVQLIVESAGLSRTRAEGNRVAAPLKPRRRIRRS